MDLTQLNDYTLRSETVCRRNDTISPRLYDEYGVKKGLRDENGNGVLAGLTNISKITSSKIVDGKKVPCDGQLWYRGYRVEDLEDFKHVFGAALRSGRPTVIDAKITRWAVPHYSPSPDGVIAGLVETVEQRFRQD